MTKHEVLAATNFGQRVAEEEVAALSGYFVETDNWRRLFSGEIDVVYGPKGSGKSALYALLLARSDELFDRNVLLIAGEKPRGTPAFRDLVADPPATEAEFTSLWKLYFLSLLSATFDEYGIENSEATQLKERLADDGLVKGQRSLQSLVHTVLDYVKRLLRPQAIEGGVNVDPATQLPIGFTGKIIFGEPSLAARECGVESVDSLLELANSALRRYAKYNVWIVLDRLDVAFAESLELEQNALRALFRVYLDLLDYDQIGTKIFLRTDIWKRITEGGFREASHITRHVTINWDRSSLLNLVIRRALFNRAIAEYYDIDAVEVLASTRSQENFFLRLCPDQVDVGSNKPTTLDWMLGRTRDGIQTNAPRELIHLLSSLRTQQMRRFELGEPDPDGESLFARAAFKQALPEVSEVRLTQTLYAEHPELRDYIEALRGQKTSQRLATLLPIWNLQEEATRHVAEQLAEVGLFEPRGTRDAPEYWVPFLYRDALDLVQGAAE
ncbi:P-loop ATPase, Sll1717 family [Salinisphaera sp. SWV1]|uniref:P-loop ATPase, Sll1717 family n=1 Tax=Salinisphaera sp. SWV1 TaxID=3454139 RepID=UPI003F877C04